MWLRGERYIALLCHQDNHPTYYNNDNLNHNIIKPHNITNNYNYNHNNHYHNYHHHHHYPRPSAMWCVQCGGQ